MRLASLLLASAAIALTASAATAADVIYEEPAAPAAVAFEPSFTWTGFYAGLMGGAATGDFDYRASADGFDEGLNLGVSGGGVFGGAQIGYDYQINSFVLGIVADIAATNIEADINGSIDDLGGASAESELTYLGTVRGRVGYAADRFLVYAHGGFAYGETEQTVTFAGTEVVDLDGQSKSGYVVGAGFEYAVTDSISVQTEYGYFDLGDDEIYGDDFFSVSEELDFHAVKAAVNFRF